MHSANRLPPALRSTEPDGISARDIEAAWTLMDMREGVRRGRRDSRGGKMVEEGARMGVGMEERGEIMGGAPGTSGAPRTPEAPSTLVIMEKRKQAIEGAPRTPVRTDSRKRSRSPEDESPLGPNSARKSRSVKLKLESLDGDGTPSKKARRGVLQCAPGAAAGNPIILKDDLKVEKEFRPPPKFQHRNNQIKEQRSWSEEMESFPPAVRHLFSIEEHD